jgi:hypothetical protein
VKKSKQVIKLTENSTNLNGDSYNDNNHNEVSVLFIPCTNCNNMIHIDDIGILKIII